MPLDWESHQEILRDLYLTKDKSLKYVITFMRDNYSFIATKAQYEQQFKIWKFRKNISHEGWHYVGHQVRKRQREGKESNVYLDNTLMPNKKVKREVSRHVSVTSEYFFSNATSLPTPDGILVCTPTPTTPQAIPASNLEPDVDLPWIKCQEFVESQVNFYDPFDCTFPQSLFDNQVYSSHPGYSLELDAYPEGLQDLPFGDMQLFNFGSPSYRHGEISIQSDNLIDGTNFVLPMMRTPMETMFSIFRESPYEPNISLNRNFSDRSQILPHLDAMVFENGPGDLKASIRHLMDPFTSNTVSQLHFLKIIVYLGSNNLLSDRQVGIFLNWFVDNGGNSILASLLQIRLPTIEAFAHQIFREALRIGNSLLVHNLIDAGVNVNLPLPSEIFFYRETPLALAILGRKVDIARILIARGADVNTSRRGSDLLCSAVRSDDIELVELLLSNGAKVNPPRRYGDLSPLEESVKHSSIPMLKLLLRSGAHTEGRHSALPLAIDRNCLTRVQLLIDAGAQIEMRDPGTMLTPLQIAARDNKSGISRLLAGKTAAGNISNLDQKCLTELRTLGDEPNAQNGNQTMLTEERESDISFIDAVRSENVDEVRRWIKLGVNVNAPDDEDEDEDGLVSWPLLIAVENGDLDLVEVLLGAGADVNGYQNENGELQTPLQRAVGVVIEDSIEYSDDLWWDEGLRLVKILLEAGADMDISGRFWVCEGFEGTPLQAAALKGPEQLFDLLLLNGANVNGLPNARDGMTVLQAAAARTVRRDKDLLEEQFRMIQRLLVAGAEINAPSSYQNGRTALQAAVESCNKSLVHLLLTRGADVNAAPAYKNGRTALQMAAEKHDLEIVQMLLDWRANVNGPTSHKLGVTALQAAIIERQEDEGFEVVQLLLSYDADIEAVAQFDNRSNFRMNLEPATSSHRTPLQIAAGTSQKRVVRLLLEKGAKINVPIRGQQYGRTALQAAAYASRADLEIVQMLLDAGADVNAPAGRSYGITALQAAASRGYIGIVFMLLRAGANINAPGAAFEGRTALEAAAEHGRLDVVQLLLNATDGRKGSEIRGYSRAILFAKRQGHYTVAKLLRDHP